MPLRQSLQSTSCHYEHPSDPPTLEREHRCPLSAFASAPVSPARRADDEGHRRRWHRLTTSLRWGLPRPRVTVRFGAAAASRVRCLAVPLVRVAPAHRCALAQARAGVIFRNHEPDEAVHWRHMSRRRRTPDFSGPFADAEIPFPDDTPMPPVSGIEAPSADEFRASVPSIHTSFPVLRRSAVSDRHW